jgi:hypothetical protein
MFDPAGPARGASTNEPALVRTIWPECDFREFKDQQELRAWFDGRDGTASRPQIRIVYDRPTAELRVTVWQGPRLAETTVAVEPDLASALHKAREFAEAVLGAR